MKFMGILVLLTILASAYFFIGAAGSKPQRQPDMIILAMNTNTTENFTLNVSTGVAVITMNNGTAPAGASSTILVTPFSEQYEKISALAAGETSLSIFMVTCTRVGVFTLKAMADVNNQVPESNENNNIMALTMRCVDNSAYISLQK